MNLKQSKMRKLILSTLVTGVLGLTAFKLDEGKLVSKNSHISIYSHTDVEDISADNYKAVSTIDPSTGDVVFSVPMQSFEFKKALMQKHFNSDKFLDTKTYPKAKFKGKITNLNAVNFSKDGTYNATVNGELTIKDVTNPVTEKGTITVKSGKVSVETKMKITLADYKIAFEKGKPSTNIAKTIDITVKADY